MEEIDSNKVVAEIVKSNLDSLFEVSKSVAKNANQQLKSRLSRTFATYLAGIQRKYSSTKTIIYRDTPQSIKQFYEPIDLRNDKMELKTPKIGDIVSLNLPLIITGTGGSGKSTLLKYLLLDTLENTKLIPIFIELRHVEQAQSSLLNFITTSLQLKSVNLDSEFLEQAFNRGNFIFFLDGFDELSNPFSQSISQEIEHLTDNFSKCTFIVTSRPGQEFISWNNFIELRTKPLTQKKATSLIKRLNFDPEIKEKFLKDLKGDLYNSHRSFFENPLLLSIMLLTYRDSASIPSELHNFYSLAFEALYYRHDASKTFKRPTLTNLPVGKGKDIMSSFSLITYLKNVTSFNHYELKEYINTALKLADCECNVDQLITDLLQAYCMLLQDGTVFEYTHRSFQEYFAACYLISTNEQNQTQLIEHFSKRADTDITLQLAYGMNPAMIEEKLIIPFLSDFKERIGFKGKITKTVFKKFSKEYFDNVTFHHERSASLSVQRDEESKTINKKSLDLGITRLIIRIFNIDTWFEPDKKNQLSNKYTDDKSRVHQIKVTEALKDIELLEWFMNHSVELRVLRELMKLESALKEKNEKNNLLFNRLLN
ncbi:NACHT domain-containing protein [Ekhidna lutea]|uniref:NACHT domain-containing protein n=1 Tax=Ekhidna lutea TaxID=447679 RepID=A0A239HT98_EKHLU|nr:NACHT domain-containing protein [Ekhidna lutea]SNS84043.1 NACHT domain-containing protein [Ekhidna lutea]